MRLTARDTRLGTFANNAVAHRTEALQSTPSGALCACRPAVDRCRAECRVVRFRPCATVTPRQRAHSGSQRALVQATIHTCHSTWCLGSQQRDETGCRSVQSVSFAGVCSRKEHFPVLARQGSMDDGRIENDLGCIRWEMTDPFRSFCTHVPCSPLTEPAKLVATCYKYTEHHSTAFHPSAVSIGSHP